MFTPKVIYMFQSCSCPLCLLIDLQEGSIHRGVFRVEPLKLDATKSRGDYKPNRRWDTHRECALVSFLYRGLGISAHPQWEWLNADTLNCLFLNFALHCIVLFSDEKERKMCRMLMAELITVPVCCMAAPLSFKSLPALISRSLVAMYIAIYRPIILQ